MTLRVCDGECHEVIGRCRGNRLPQRDMNTDEDGDPQKHQQYGTFHVQSPCISEHFLGNCSDA
jgi:hypothetical protein